VAPSVTGSVTVELRRGEDYTLVSTAAEHMGYAPDKLSMERVAEPAFTPEDRIGALELQNLSVGDNRDLLLHHLEAVRALGAGAPQAPRLGALLGTDDGE
jgi:argininosuccinate synthase